MEYIVISDCEGYTKQLLDQLSGIGYVFQGGAFKCIIISEKPHCPALFIYEPDIPILQDAKFMCYSTVARIDEEAHVILEDEAQEDQTELRQKTDLLIDAVCKQIGGKAYDFRF